MKLLSHPLVLGLLLLTFPSHLGAESLEAAYARTVLRSVEISLQEEQLPELATWLRDLRRPPEFEGASLLELQTSLLQQIQRLQRRDQHPQAQLEGMARAFQRSRDFLHLDHHPLRESLSHSREDCPSSDPLALTQRIENWSSQVQAVNWPGVEGYTTSRLGPLVALVETLEAGDRVLLSNASLQELLCLLDAPLSLTHLHLPLSSYGKSIYLALGKSGQKTLILADFDSRAYLHHFGLLLTRVRHELGLQFQIREFLDETRLRQSYRQLLDFAESHPSLFQGLEALVIGYSEAFGERWRESHQERGEQRGFEHENWKIDRYQISPALSVGVLTGDVDYYGEGLARQLDRLLERFPVSKIFFGGSGGSLVPTRPYHLVVPRVLQSPEGHQVLNLLAGSHDGGLHRSVDSPLLETPEFLARSLQQGVTSLDMEAGHLATLAVTRGIQVGAAILATDYPTNAGNLGVSLGKQDFGAKRTSRQGFARAVEGVLLGRPRQFLHPIEESTGLALPVLSGKNLERLREQTRPFSDQEMEFLRRLGEQPFLLISRMSPGRLWWTLKDGALLSTGLVEAWGTATKPFTPKLEDELFGAFDYVFAQLGTQLGRRRYGDVIAFLDASVLSRSWASRGSGWNLGGTRESLIPEVFHPDHFQEVLGLQAVRELRKQGPEALQDLLATPDGDWPPRLYELGIGYLEIKIRSYVLRSEISRVRLTAEVQGEIPGLLERFAIPFERYDPSGDPH